jgi:hypothetical protein
MKLAKSYDPYVNHALDRQIGDGLTKLQPISIAREMPREMWREVKRRHAEPLLALVCVCSLVAGWSLA